MTTQIIQLGPPLLHLNLFSLTTKKLAEQGSQILRTLLDKDITSLEYFNLGKNGWFREHEENC